MSPFQTQVIELLSPMIDAQLDKKSPYLCLDNLKEAVEHAVAIKALEKYQPMITALLTVPNPLLQTVENTLVIPVLWSTYTISKIDGITVSKGDRQLFSFNKGTISPETSYSKVLPVLGIIMPTVYQEYHRLIRLLAECPQ